MNSPIDPTTLGWKKWIIGARPRTLPAAIVPVLVGVACASGAPSPIWWRGALAGIVSLALQVGVNYANDYSDGVKGTDAVRVGPLRLVGSGAATANHVKQAAFAMFGIAACAGLALAVMTTMWLVLVGAAAILAAWTYTGGPRPYGYAGWGEVFVFLFFGVVATTGTQFVVAEKFTLAGLVASVAVGCFACSLLVVNNLRDIPGDTVAGKSTLAVKLGDPNTRKFFAGLVILAVVSIGTTSVLVGAYALFGLVGIVVLRPALEALSRGAKGRDLIIVLGNVGRAQLVMGITFAAGIAYSIVS
ncbi:MAG: 1,4-dihydroxy-2-naphthoate polyprenyltransferase [Ilumatobacteraceae bacterium]